MQSRILFQLIIRPIINIIRTWFRRTAQEMLAQMLVHYLAQLFGDTINEFPGPPPPPEDEPEMSEPDEPLEAPDFLGFPREAFEAAMEEDDSKQEMPKGLSDSARPIHGAFIELDASIKSADTHKSDAADTHKSDAADTTAAEASTTAKLHAAMRTASKQRIRQSAVQTMFLGDSLLHDALMGPVCVVVCGCGCVVVCCSYLTVI